MIESSLALFYPHLVESFAFMDFEGVRAQGGAASLVATLKAFIGAGIANRVVALFDNDTAAASALRGLSGITIPSNVRVLRYPKLDLGENYPTLGPTGISKMDINGLAGGLELYFGEDVLRGGDGDLTPVQWRGYDEGVQQYHGELMNKRELAKRFQEKLHRCMKDPDRIPLYDWAGIQQLLRVLRRAFVDG